MLGRRTIRIKVMQSIYSLNTNEFLAVPVAKKNLEKSIQLFLELYHYHLYTFTQLVEFIEVDADIKSNKHLKSEDDEEVNAKLLTNHVYLGLHESERLDIYFQKARFSKFKEDHVIRDLYQKMLENEKYKAYLENKLSGSKEDFDIAHYLLTKVIVKNEVYKKNIEDHFINYEDDYSNVLKVLSQSSKKSKRAEEFSYLIYKKDNYYFELEEFATNLFAKTIDHRDGLEAEIEGYLKNWDKNRLAQVDIILLKMALCELLYFEEIPVKVTINEYIEISKKYSTPKSKEFINGVLDKMMKDLINKGKIVKKGRGLK